MGNNDQAGGPLDHAVDGTCQVFGIERGKTFVEHHQCGGLQQCAGEIHAAALDLAGGSGS